MEFTFLLKNLSMTGPVSTGVQQRSMCWIIPVYYATTTMVMVKWVPPLEMHEHRKLRVAMTPTLSNRAPQVVVGVLTVMAKLTSWRLSIIRDMGLIFFYKLQIHYKVDNQREQYCRLKQESNMDVCPNTFWTSNSPIDDCYTESLVFKRKDRCPVSRWRQRGFTSSITTRSDIARCCI